jgi:hypothetical protein
VNSIGQHRSGVTWIDILVVVATIGLVAGLLLLMLAKSKARSSRIGCVNHLKQIGLGMRMFSNDHQDNFPWLVPGASGGSLEYSNFVEIFRHFLVVSNELSTPKVLACPNDTSRVKTTNWDKLSNGNISYFVGLDSNEGRPTSVLSGDRTLSISNRPVLGLMLVTSNSQPRVLPGVHSRAINLAFGDGSAQEMTEAAARDLILYTNALPLRFLIP